MLIIIQFPLADSRPFVDLDTGFLHRPLWPFPGIDQDFIRSFGIVRRRWSGGLSGWIGENSICNAVRALRVDPIPPANLPNMRLPIRTRLAFRRFYSDGMAMAKYEVGLVITPEPLEQSPDLLLTRQFFEYFLRLPVSVPTPQGIPARCDIWQAGKYLASLYLASSSTTKASRPGNLQPWLVLAGNPIILVEYSSLKRLRVSFPSKCVTLAKYPEAMVSHFMLPMEGLNLRLWMLNANTMPREDARKLRIALFRLHAERECLQRILSNLACGRIQVTPRGATSNSLQQYFNQATQHVLTLRRRSAAAFEQEDQEEEQMVEIARWAEDAIMPGERDSISSALEQMEVRKNIRIKVEDFVATRVSRSEEKVKKTMHQLGMDDASKDRVVMILADEAANSPVDPKSYFHNLVLKMALPQKLKNAIIGIWKGDTNYDARRLVEWSLSVTLPGNKEPMIINLMTKAMADLGEEDRAFFDRMINAFHQKAMRQRIGEEAP